MPTRILGISAYYHDSAACLVEDGRIVAAAQEERFTRKKHDAEFPAHAARYCLEAGGLTADRLDHVTFYDKPLVKFERLFETYLEYAPRGFASFRKAMPLWIGNRLWMSEHIGKELGFKGRTDRLNYSASVFYADWQNPQLNTATSNWGFFAAINGKSATSTGIELELSGQLADSLSYSLGYTYADSKLTADVYQPAGNFYGTAGRPVFDDRVAADGDRLPGTAKNIFSVSLTHDLTLGNGIVTPDLGGTATTRSRGPGIMSLAGPAAPPRAVRSRLRTLVPREAFRLARCWQPQPGFLSQIPNWGRAADRSAATRCAR